MKNILVLTLAIAIIGIVVLNNHLVSDVNNNEFNCRASFTVSSYGFDTSVIANIRSNDGHGVLFYDGPVYRDNNKVGYISRQVKFDLVINEQWVLFKGVSLNKNEIDNISQEVAVKLLPDFFVKDNSRIYFDIKKDKQGYFFIKDNIPMFYCRG